MQGTLSDEIKPNSSSCSDDLQCDTGAAFDKNVSTVTIASPMGNTSPKLSWIKFKLDKVYYISEIKVLLCKDGQNKLTIDTYMKMEHLENVAKVQSEQNRKEQIFRPTSLADKIIITNINKKIVISEIIILGMAGLSFKYLIYILHDQNRQRCRSVFNFGGIILYFYRFFGILKFCGVNSGFAEHLLNQLKTRIRKRKKNDDGT